MPTPSEIQRRYANIRTTMREHGVEALIVCGNQYAGFEGAVFYTSGFEIVHRYVYVLVPLKGEPVLLFPQEARWIGDRKKPFVQDKVWAEIPGRWLCERARDEAWKRVAVYGLDHIMAVRDYRELERGPFELVPFDFHFDMARAVKSEEELVEIRDSMDIIHAGFRALLEGFAPGKTEAEIMAPAVEVFFARGAGPRMMNIVLSGENGEAEAHFKVPGHRRVGERDLLLYSLEIAGAGGYWVEFSRAIIEGEPSRRTRQMAEVYPEAMEAARRLMREGVLACDVHRVVAETFGRSGFALGHLSGHSIGTTMIEHPAIGANSQVELKENMIFSLHPQVVDEDGSVCLYTQDTFRVGRSEGENLSSIPWKFYSRADVRPLAGRR
ncbi:MAG TPA: M24 family metallopeptidase [Candidatus Binatia bacterium]|nr:M24 family metallopeptidase [Candidatus Binatia bacterium]